MARINIEDKLWSDPRFEFLLLKTGNEFVAIGMVVKAFRVAQKYWLKDQGLIPKNIWDAFGLSVLVDCDLAELIDGYIYVRGVAEQNDWLLKKQAAGKKSAESRLAQFGSNQPKKPEQCSSSVPNTSRTVFDPLEPPTPTPTLNTLGKPPRSSGAPLAIEWLNFGQSWLDFALRHTKSKKPPPSWTPENFGKELAKVSRSIGLSLAELSNVMKWADSDDFWPVQITSPAGLLVKSKNGNRKIDNLLAAFDKSVNSPFKNKSVEVKPVVYTKDWGL